MLGAFCAQDLALFVVFFDLMLVPFYFLIGIWGAGRTACAATTKLVIYTLVGSLLMLAAAIATGVLAAEPARRRRSRSRSPTSQQAAALDTARRSGSSCASRPRSWSRCRPSRSTAGCPTATGRCRCRCWRSSPACSRRSPPTASCAIVLPLFPDALGALPDADAADRAGLDPLRLGAGVHARPTRGWSLGYSSVAQLGFITLGIFALNPTGRAGRAAADGQPRARRRAAVLHRRAAGRARRRLGGHPRHGRDRVPRAGARGAVPDRRAGHAGDARLVELRRRVPDPARRLQGQARRSRSSPSPAWCWRSRLRAAAVHPRDAQPRRAAASSRARSRSATRARARRRSCS